MQPAINKHIDDIPGLRCSFGMFVIFFLCLHLYYILFLLSMIMVGHIYQVHLHIGSNIHILRFDFIFQYFHKLIIESIAICGEAA